MKRSLCIAGLCLIAACTTPKPLTYPVPQPVTPTQPEGAPTPPPEIMPAVPADAPRLYPQARLKKCPGIRVSNPQPTDRSGYITSYGRLVEVIPGKPLVLAPVTKGCMSSGFGPRDGSNHNGLDLAANPGSDVFAAGTGILVEARDRNTYGNQVLIDHGNGIYTRYAHLARLAPGLLPGMPVYFGMPLGVMGNTGRSRGIHLHYEILAGYYQDGVARDGLNAFDPFSFPLYGPSGDGPEAP